jgi:hypothetical protein
VEGENKMCGIVTDFCYSSRPVTGSWDGGGSILVCGTVAYGVITVYTRVGTVQGPVTVSGVLFMPGVLFTGSRTVLRPVFCERGMFIYSVLRGGGGISNSSIIV